MKINTTIDGKSIQITLTGEQLREISRQQKKSYKVDDITSYEIACEILGEDPIDVRIDDRLRKIIKAANYISNGNKQWTPDFSNTSQHKYSPYFEKLGSGGWSVNYCYYYSLLGFGFYFQNKDVCLKIANRFLPLYVKYLTQDPIV
jgi:hypothetical protein